MSVLQSKAKEILGATQQDKEKFAVITILTIISIIVGVIQVWQKCNKSNLEILDNIKNLSLLDKIILRKKIRSELKSNNLSIGLCSPLEEAFIKVAKTLVEKDLVDIKKDIAQLGS